jgi:hypothetical protein
VPHPDTVESIGRALARHGYQVGPESIGGRAVVVGRRSDFRLRWMAARLHTFVVVTRFDEGGAGPDTAGLDAFLDASCRYAVGHKQGLPRGLQTGTAAVAVAVVDRAGPDALAWADHSHGSRFAAITYPVTVEAATGRVVHPPRKVVGAVFNGHLKAVAEEIVAPAVRA